MATPYEVPEHLKEAILNDRCVAFVGAGFPGNAVPSWHDLLKRTAGKLDVQVAVTKEMTAFELESIAQELKDRAGRRWAATVHEVLDAWRSANLAAGKTLERRTEQLLAIPFRAVLTTNFDTELEGQELSPSAYAEVLRSERATNRGWWLRAPRRTPAGALAPWRTPVLKLHGDLNPLRKPRTIVLARSEYRRRLYEDANYANFVRSCFSQYTMLFLGVSFTDAYLNELRSEVLNFIRKPAGKRPDAAKPWGYAVVADPNEVWRAVMRRHESIEVLPFSARGGDFSGFDHWLSAIRQATSLKDRLATLFRGKNVVWSDPSPANNRYGIDLIGPENVQLLAGPKPEEAIEPGPHGEAAVIITNYGHEGQGRARAFRLLERVSSWESRPPVVVFAAPGGQAAENRRQCLRRGAFEYVTQWPDLFRVLERVLKGDSSW